MRARRDVAGDRDDRDRVEEGGADAGHEVRRARAGRPHADADAAGDAGVAVGGVGAALLVADEDVAQLGVVAEDVVERQDHAAGVAEEDVDALAEERLADDVGADARPLPRPRVVEHRLAGLLDGRRARACRRWGHGCGARRARRRGTRRLRRSDPSSSSSQSPDPGFKQTKNPRHPARVPSVFGGAAPSVRSSEVLRSPAGSR